ncbi:hypothetical protein SAMD00019534_056300 [Acytostelium subglobosum LB1]|uniref:hypothetical protein n=1 Tax=Acytostelium subglobosum LB1 TaxID=1410327 RepID=UPI000644C193|nr:hypothetical protein SAMD00019534_056300 [Acytostelium subglobosum LB1]GAM22455.1 hypothetical protein SAMD00019534_056300 [Acytostelium subglobosum LB1]|eukprot:XP_012754575.1 hypothetical protein SAMD00019534_056300 [Acytostelium subglobosum LB1]
MVVTVNMAGFSTNNTLFYYSNDTSCPKVDDKLCAGNGRCSQGTCYCYDGWTRANCTEPTNPNDQTPGMRNGTASNPAGIEFISSIRYLRELNQTGQVVRTLDMNNIRWITDNVTGIVNGTFSNDTVSMSLVVLQVNQSIDRYQFAGQVMALTANSLKLIISIADWSFKSNLNSLQVIIQSKTNSTTRSACGTEHQTSGEVDTNSYHIVSGNSILQVKFASHLYVDGRVAVSEFTQLDAADPIVLTSASNDTFSLWTAINVPHFKVCAIDPSMAALLGNDKETCSTPSNWKTIVIAVLASVVGLAILIGAAVLIKKKLTWNRQEQRIMKRQMSSLKDSRL